MRPGIALRPDYDAAQLRALAKASRNAGQSRRLLAVAEIYDGGSRTEAARVGSVGLQTLRDWVVRFNAHGPDRLIANRRDAADIARGPLSIQVQLSFSLKCRASVKMRVSHIQAQIIKNEIDAATCSYKLAL